jgi:hypothetical protein
VRTLLSHNATTAPRLGRLSAWRGHVAHRTRAIVWWRRLRRDQLSRQPQLGILRRGPSRHHSESHRHRSVQSGAHQQAVPGRHRRRRPHDLEPQPLSRDSDRRRPADEHHVRRRLHHRCTLDNPDGCLSSTPSDVIWNFSTSTSGSAHPYAGGHRERQRQRQQSPDRGPSPTTRQ